MEVGVRVAGVLGLNGKEATAAQLRATPADQFGQATVANLSAMPGPVSGDPVLPRSIQDTFAAGREAPMPLIVGNVSDDASVVAAFGVEPAAVIRRLGVAGVLVKALYPGVKDESQLGSQVARDVVFTMNTRWIADRHSRLAPTWRYYFDYTALRNRNNVPHGVPHGGEVAYVLNTVDRVDDLEDILSDDDRAFARRVSEYWFEFARSGTPVSRTGPDWPNHDRRHDRTMLFGQTTSLQSNFMRVRLNAFIGVIGLLDTVTR